MTPEELRAVARAVIENPLCLCGHHTCKYKQMQVVAQDYLRLTEQNNNAQGASQGGSQGAVSGMQQDQEDTRQDVV